MTVGEALERAEELRPGCTISPQTRMDWLRQADAMLRQNFEGCAAAEEFASAGADVLWQDGLQDKDVLLAPAPFDALYPHYLCAMIDSALGENDRYAGEQSQCNAIMNRLYVWLRRSHRPEPGPRWTW